MKFALLASTALAANPIRRVVTLLQDMKKEITAEGEKEKKLYQDFKCYCKENNGKLGDDAKQAQETITAKNAEATEKAAQKVATQEELKQHKADRKEAKESLKQATEVRLKEKKAYDAALGESKAHLSAMDKAITALEKGKGSSFLQSGEASMLRTAIMSNSMSMSLDASDAQQVMAFLQGDYHSVGGEIIGILKEMRDEFNRDQGGLIGTEDEAVKNYNAFKKAKEEAIAAATSAIESKTELVGKLAVEAVEAKAAAEAAAKELGDAQEFLVKLQKMCSDKDGDWKARSEERAQEIAAIDQAVAVLNDDDALDIFKSAIATPKPKSFLQTASRRNSPSVRAAEILKRTQALAKGKNQGLVLLANTARQALKSNTDFSKIVTMIDEMVVILTKEGETDAESLQQCTDDLESSEADKKDTEDKIAGFESAIREAESKIAEGKTLIEQKKEEIVALDKARDEAIAQRKQEASDYDDLVALNTSAVQLLKKAINKLNQFYNPSMYKAPEQRQLTEEERILQGAGQDIGSTLKGDMIEGTAQTVDLVQKPSLPDAPETFGKTYERKNQKSNSVIKLIDMMVNDLNKETHTAEMEEKQAIKDFEALIKDTAASRKSAEKVVTETQTSVANLEEALGTAQTGLAASQDRLREIIAQIANLHSECDFIIAHFEERKAARVQEIEGLKTAKAILSGANYE